MDSRIRLYQNNLYSSGRAVIFFGLWSCVRLLLTFYTSREELLEMFESASAVNDITLNKGMLFWMTVTIIILLSLADLLLRFYLGRCAMQEARGHKKGRLWLGVTALYTLLCLGMDLSMIQELHAAALLQDVLNDLSSLFIDLTSSLAMIIMLVSAIQLRWLSKCIKIRERSW